MVTKISPSILNADFTSLGKLADRLEAAGADMLHLDVMDGQFVPNISFGFPVIESLKKHTRLPLDVHLMIAQPHRFAERFVKAGADILGIHYEAGSDAKGTLRQIREFGAKPCIAICPATPVHVLYDLLEEVSQVLIMTVQPGYGGQKFMQPMLEKVRKLRTECERRGLEMDIQVDGGIDSTTAPLVKQAGANVLVAGSALICAQDIGAAVEELKSV